MPEDNIVGIIMYSRAFVIVQKNKTNENHSNDPDPSEINFLSPNHVFQAVTTTDSDIPTSHQHTDRFGPLRV